MQYHNMGLLDKVKVIEFPKVCDPRGNLSFVEGARHIPFSIKRVYYIYDVPGGETRGGHAHRNNTSVVFAPSGSVDVRLTDGDEELSIRLDRSNRGVLIPPGVWATYHNFTTGTVLAALASHLYEEEDYIRDYDDYLEYVETLEKI